ncbi:ran guanine nucleotide release factor isoform X1 [Oncorhynchus nerka]|uniref:ran guanine nucleotide release factor isoform X1 n=1 Tax=Oncorhynchus nerka TaxID=8023 RepID=UPI0011313D6D|nr:ran guanine nucleotide release factor isoform X1 [Oncorhynchus nerka]
MDVQNCCIPPECRTLQWVVLYLEGPCQPPSRTVPKTSGETKYHEHISMGNSVSCGGKAELSQEHIYPLPPLYMSSELREIPDNQEIFAHDHNDQSIIVELLELQSHVQNGDAARYHFEDVAGSNKASAPGTSEARAVVALPKSDLSLEECSSAFLLTGTQCVAKFNEEAKNTVTIHLGLFRLPQFSTDVLVTFNDPLSISPGSSSAVGMGGEQQEDTEPWTLQDFQCLLQSLRLHDPGVFG